MTKFFRGAILSAISLGLVLSQSNLAQAQTVKDKAALVVRVKSIDNLLDSVAYMVGAAGFRNFVPAITLGAGAFLEGFDTERPIGGYLTLEGGAPNFVAFIPVEDLDDVIDMLINNIGEDFIEEDGDDYIIATPTGEEIVIRGKGKWAFIAANKEMLKDLPADPSKLVADIPEEYGIAVRAYIQRIPADLRSQAIEWMEEAFDETYRNLPDGIGELQRKMNENSLDQLAGMIQQSDQITFGLAADKKGKRLFADVTFTAVKGSDLSKQLTAGKGATTEFASFMKMQDAAMKFNAASKIGEADAANAKATFSAIKDQIGTLLSEDANMSEEDAKLVEELVGELVDVVVATVESGKSDMGGAAIVDDSGLNIVAGAHIVNSANIAKALKKVHAAKGDQIPPQIEVKFDAESHQGVTFHTVAGSIPEEEAHAILGETTTLAIGVGKDKVYIGFGSDPISKLKKAIDSKSTQKVEVMAQASLKIAPILRLVSKVNDDAMISEMAEKLEDKGNDSLKITSEIIENGQKTRFELQDGILSLIQSAASGLGGGFGGADF